MDLLDWGQQDTDDFRDFENEFEREYHKNFESLMHDSSMQYPEAPSSFNFDFLSAVRSKNPYEISEAMQTETTNYHQIPQQFSNNYGYNPYAASQSLLPIKQEHSDKKLKVSTHYNESPYLEYLPPTKQQKQQTQLPKFEKQPAPPTHAPFDILIESQPPGEVRTRTPSEIRTFGVTARVVGNFRKEGATLMKVQLYYSPNDTQPSEQVKRDILGGTKTTAVLADGLAVLDNLTISESSTKHKEREFCLQLTLMRNDGTELCTKLTRPFYAYSHKKVLQRRGSVTLRVLSKNWGKISGGDQMHVIGNPFIQGPALSLIFRTAHGDVYAKPLEYYSDSVLFFELPPYPLPNGVGVTPETELQATVLLTNDGRTFSNALEFTYVSDVSIRARFN